MSATPSWSSLLPEPPSPYVELYSPRPEYYAHFGEAIAVSGDGSTLAVGSTGGDMNVRTHNRRPRR
jgi:hypothetical protein